VTITSVNGHKTWTTLAQHADWIFCLVRTDPTAKHRRHFVPADRHEIARRHRAFHHHHRRLA